MVLPTLLIFLGLAVVLGLFYVFGKEFGEFENGFVYVTWGVILLVVGTAVYLAYAVPSFAEQDPLHAAAPVTIEQSNLLSE